MRAEQRRRPVLVEAALLLPFLCCFGCSGEEPGARDGGGATLDGATLDGAPSMDDGASPRPDGAVDDGAAPRLDGSADGAVSRVDAGTAPAELARMVELCHAWGDIVCGAQQRCCAADERTDASEAECQSRYYTGCDLLHSGEAFLDGRITMNVLAAEGYIAMMRTLAAACDPDAGEGPGKFLAGTIPLGGDCTPVSPRIGPRRDASALLACVPGLYCDLSMDASGYHGVCRALELSGGSCSSTNDCDPTAHLTCDTMPGGTCVPSFADGVTCSWWRDCAGGYCDHLVCTSTPHPRWCNM